MICLKGSRAYVQLIENVRNQRARIPDKSVTAHYRSGGIFPKLSPRFCLNQTDKIFTIGSCFAREIEWVLLSHGFEVAVSQFQIPMPEGTPQRSLDLLNEYNAGTISQRLQNVTNSFKYDDTAGLEDLDKGFVDLFLDLDDPVPLSLLIERRLAVHRLYETIAQCQVVIITLGLVESWYDRKFGCYLNRAPSRRFVREADGRFEFHRLDVEDVYSRLCSGIEVLDSLGVRKILLTVSPVPLQATFMDDNVVMANSYSKAVLRVVVDMLVRFLYVDYYPSYEIVTSFGTDAFRDDNIHVTPEIVDQVTSYMLENYLH